jgi:GTPase
MAFVDQVTIQAWSGKGGDGVIRWRRTREKARAGPGGGDGGRGGDLVFVGVRDLAALSQYRFQKKFRAENGEAGSNELRHGKDGEPLLLQVPVGTQIRIKESGEVFEIVREGEQLVVFKGGRGGLGNARFKSSVNQNPFEQTSGKEGKGGTVELELKIIADAGLIGLPNAGKSSLINALTRSKSKVGDYPFTTLAPNLGDFHGHILADIPGLIQGASSGRGLGIKFLRHIERTGTLLHLVSAEQDDPIAAYREVRKEVESFGKGLAQKPEIVILSKIDLIDPSQWETKKELLAQKTGREVFVASVKDAETLDTLSRKISQALT